MISGSAHKSNTYFNLSYKYKISYNNIIMHKLFNYYSNESKYRFQFKLLYSMYRTYYHNLFNIISYIDDM